VLEDGHEVQRVEGRASVAGIRDALGPWLH
jgi:hypothetical protein